MIYTEPVTEDDLRPEHTVIDPVSFTFKGDHPKTASVTVTISGPLCKMQDFLLPILSFVKRYVDENPGKPCGCKDKKVE